jgi:beta-phosphoglucomutase
MLQAVVFDFDGVIADSEPLHLRAYQAVLENQGISLSRDDYYTRYLGYDDAGLFRALARDRGLSVENATIQEWIGRKSRIVEDMLSRDSILFPGAATCIRTFAARVPLAIASGALEHEIATVLGHAGLNTCFSAIASASDGVPGKPEPDLYLLALTKLRRTGVVGRVDTRACLAIEDSQWGLEAALKAGLRCAAVTHTYAPSHLASADLVVDSLEELTVARIDALMRDNGRQQ